MKNNQRIFVLAAIIAFAFCAVQVQAQASKSTAASKSKAAPAPAVTYSPESDFEFGPSPDGKGVYITKYIGSEEVVSIPPTIQGRPVLGISRANVPNIPEATKNAGVFEGNKTVKTITVPEGVTNITRGFTNTVIETITLPASLPACNGLDFNGSTSLAKIILKAETSGAYGAKFTGTVLFRGIFTPGTHASKNVRIYVPANSFSKYLTTSGWGKQEEWLIPMGVVIKITVLNQNLSSPKLPVTVWIGDDKSTAKTIAWGKEVEFSVPVPDGTTRVVLWAERSDHKDDPIRYGHVFNYGSFNDVAKLRYFKDGDDLPFFDKL